MKYQINVPSNDPRPIPIWTNNVISEYLEKTTNCLTETIGRLVRVIDSELIKNIAMIEGGDLV